MGRIYFVLEVVGIYWLEWLEDSLRGEVIGNEVGEVCRGWIMIDR